MRKVGNIAPTAVQRWMERMIKMNEDFATIRKLGAILQTKKATKEEVKEAYENSDFARFKHTGKECSR